MKNLFLICLAIGLFIFGYYLGVERSIKSEASSIKLETELAKSLNKCIESSDLECIRNTKNLMFMFKKTRIEYLLKNELNIELGQSIENYSMWLGEQIATSK